MSSDRLWMPLLLHPKEDRIIKKRRNGVVLYTKSKRPKLVEHKNIQTHRYLCTAAYR